MKRIFTNFEMYLEDSGYIFREDHEKIFDLLKAGIVTKTDVLKCAKEKGGYSCGIESKGYQNFKMKNAKVDVIDLEGFHVNSVGDLFVNFQKESVCGLITPPEGRKLEGKRLIVCKEIGGI